MHEDQSAPDKADAGYDLRSNTRGIQYDRVPDDGVTEAVFGYKHDERSGDTHECVRAKPGALGTELSFQSDQRRKYKGKTQFAELDRRLTLRLSIEEFRQMHGLLLVAPFKIR